MCNIVEISHYSLTFCPTHECRRLIYDGRGGVERSTREIARNRTCLTATVAELFVA